MRRLLILACSQRKRRGRKLLQARERYDGPPFRVLRRYLRSAKDPGLQVYVLSAKYGLIPASKRIANYNRKMNTTRADDLRSSVAASALLIIKRYKPNEILVCSGKTYLRALHDLTDNFRNLSVAAGSQGQKLACLKKWLNHNNNEKP